MEKKTSGSGRKITSGAQVSKINSQYDGMHLD